MRIQGAAAGINTDPTGQNRPCCPGSAGTCDFNNTPCDLNSVIENCDYYQGCDYCCEAVSQCRINDPIGPSTKKGTGNPSIQGTGIGNIGIGIQQIQQGGLIIKKDPFKKCCNGINDDGTVICCDLATWVNNPDCPKS